MQISTYFFFFFSSRRRHTRWNCDWSSDVCSSDLVKLENPRNAKPRLEAVPYIGPQAVAAAHPDAVLRLMREGIGTQQIATQRSEERRVGKECRSRWEPDD